MLKYLFKSIVSEPKRSIKVHQTLLHT